MQGIDMAWSHIRPPMRVNFLGFSQPVTDRHVCFTFVGCLAYFTVP